MRAQEPQEGGAAPPAATEEPPSGFEFDDARDPASEPIEPLGDELLESLMDTNLYSMGAFFSDQHPELVEEIMAWSEAIEHEGLRGYAAAHGLTVEECFKTLLTGLAVRYYKAVAA